MTYEEVLESIHSRKAFSHGGPTLERIRRLMDCLGNPQEKFRTVHIAGTNGKGSTAAMTANILQTAGYATGLYTSPFLIDFRERIQMNGRLISREELVRCYELVMLQELELENAGFEPVNEFELVTAIGFVAFERAHVDFAVLEVGLGGRTDATNIVRHPEVCCITPVSLDHVAVLGDTIPKIAAEKAGIIKQACPCVIARQTAEATDVILAAAAQKNAPVCVCRCTSDIVFLPDGISFSYRENHYTVPFIAAYQADNTAAVIEICRYLSIPEALIKKGLRTVKWPARLQLIHDRCDILIDAGHNRAGVDTIVQVLDARFSERRILSVMAMMKDKDYNYCIPSIARKSACVYAATVNQPRSLQPEQLAETAAVFTETVCCADVADAVSQALQDAAPNDLVLVCGSVYAAGDALKYLSETRHQNYL